MMKRLLPLGLACGLFLAACDDGVDLPTPQVAIGVAALSLQGVGDVVWDLQVVSGAGGTVWERRITSSRYGDGAGSASFVGPCDADAGAASNTVNVWVVGVYASSIAPADAGSFAAGDASAIAPPTLDFVNPTQSAPLQQTFTCVPDGDTAVAFDVALMRPAEQGFFDVAVNFNDLYCSAKFDCCADADGDGCEPAEQLTLLFDTDGARGRTFVLAFACTAGAEEDVRTDLYLDPLALDCTSPNADEDFAADVVIDTSAGGPGNLCAAGNIGGCPGVTPADSFDPNDFLFQIASYRGTEALTSGGVSAQKVYWNVALGVKDAVSSCRLRTRATADDRADDLDHVVNGVIASGAVYPVLRWDVDLGVSCTSEALTFGDPDAPVRTEYATTTTAEPPFAAHFAPGAPAGGFCTPACANGGSCVGGTCQCPSGFTGAQCQTPTCVTGTQVFAATGGDQSFTMPANCGTLTVKLWGAGGGAGRVSTNYDSTYTAGGAGGFTTATLAVAPGSTLTVVVGAPGTRVSGASTAPTYGGGGGTQALFGGAKGGGRSALRAACGEVVTAGGGGGGSNSQYWCPDTGGGGGGTAGVMPSCPRDLPQAGGGGTQTAGGAASPYNGATAGTALVGGLGSYTGALTNVGGHPTSGGGGGYFGGGGGNIGPGGGGSGYVGGCGTLVPLSGSTTAAGGATPPATEDADYLAGAGVGGDPTGGPGRVVVHWSN